MTVGDERLTVRWRPGVASALDTPDVDQGRDVGAVTVTDRDGSPVAADEPLWFAVAAFHPDARIVRQSDP